MFGLRLGAMGRVGAGLTLTQQAINVLRKFGTDAHIYLPGIGVVNGLTAGNFSDTGGAVAAIVDSTAGVGRVNDGVGTINATQGTTANKPILRRGAVNRLLWSRDLTNAVWLNGAISKIDAETIQDNIGGSVYQTVAVTPGLTYAFTWEAKSGTSNNAAYAVYNNIGAAFIVSPTSYFSYINSSGYSRVGIRFTAPVGCVSVRVYQLGGTSTAGGLIYFRNHMLHVVQPNNGVAIGDSFTSSAVYPTQTALTTATTITNKGTSGNKLGQMQTRFAADVVSLAPQYVVIQGGINDIANASTDPLAGMQTAMTTMVGQAQAAGIRPIIVNTSAWGAFTTWTAQRQLFQDAYNTWLAAYCQTNGLSLVDANALLRNPSNPQNLLPAFDSGDGLHPNSAGYRALGVAVASAVGLPEAYIPTTTAAASSPTGPYWWEFDGTDFLSLASVPFQVQDDSCVVLGARANGNGNQKAFSIRSPATPSSGSFSINWEIANTRWIAGAGDGASSVFLVTPVGSTPQGVDRLLSYRKVGNNRVFRVNAGLQSATSSTALASTTITNADIGKDASAAFDSLVGALYTVIVIKGTVTDADLAILERWVAQLSGVTL